MAFVLNEKLRGMKAYEPIEGSYRIRLDANESFILPDDELEDAISEAVNTLAFNRYPDSAAAKLCSLAAEFYGVKAENVTAGNGSDELIGLILSAFLQKGDKVISFSHDFSMYSFYAHLVEADLIEIEKNADFTVDFDKVSKIANEEKARIIIFSNPCNPTSLGVDSKTIEKLIKSVNALVVLDEAYMDFFGDSLSSKIDDFDNLIVLRTMSKAMGMAGIRMGFALANKMLSDIIKTVKSPYNVNSVSQIIACEVFSRPEFIKQSINKIISSRDDLTAQFKALEEKPPEGLSLIGCAANFIFAKASRASDLYEFLKSRGVVIRLFGS
ncbi:MAG TPA: aminotransferase class I/II-fold pyridoxal phosphate-dependent enzyme, partial [Oscillospiraceae bacterium]|nr:aminotransferase class I/II-fold pyridoxal phosphate-dependent enzyme [Oscillospiraceae bacterium]